MSSFSNSRRNLDAALRKETTMKKLRFVLLSLFLIGTLAFAVPMPTYADGPQGGGNSGPRVPPPPIRPPLAPEWLLELLIALVT